MTSLAVFLLAAGLFPCLSAQLGPVRTSQQDSQKYTLTGTVVNSVTGEPVPQALVQIGGGAVLTDSDGHFEFDNLPPETTSLQARKPSFFSEMDASHGFAGHNDFVEIGPDTKPVTLKLVPQGVLVGRVTSGGEPLEDVPVRVIASRIENGYKMWTQTGSGSTNEDGDFRVAGLIPGTYYVSAGPKVKGLLLGGAQNLRHSYAEAYYTAATDLAGAAPVEVAAGQQVEVDFALSTVALFHLSGVVEGQNPGQFAQLQFMDQDGNASSLPMRMNPQTGQFDGVVAAGSYTLKARIYGPNGAGSEAELPISVHSDLSDIRLVLSPAIFIPIHVRQEDVAPQAPGSRSRTLVPQMVRTVNGRRVVTEMPLVYVSLTQHRRSLQNWGTSASMGGNPEKPELAIRDLEPGTYSATITGIRPWYVASASCGSTDLLTDDLTIVAGVQPPPIEVVLRNDPATISGTVSADGPFQNATILLFPDGATHRAITFPASNGGGFKMPGLAPGDYTAVAVDRTEGLEYANPDVMRPYLTQAVHITLQANQETKVNLSLVHVEQLP